LWTKYHLEKFRHIAESKATTMGHIKREDLKKSLVVIPNELELDKMNNIFNPILSKIIKNSIETQTLTKLRDELLPKLMSGEVRV
jgi:type I restriction enzyme S subunit